MFMLCVSVVRAYLLVSDLCIEISHCLAIVAAHQAVICITGTCVHDKISEQLSPLHEVRQAFSNAWNKIKKYL